MPIHDWTRVSAGTWHDFHLAWISEIRNVLNGGLLPPDHYAQAEQIAGPLGPDVLTLQEFDPETSEAEPEPSNGNGGTMVATAPPRTRYSAAAELDDYVLKRRTLVIRHVSGDRIVALIELVSPGNKSSRHALQSFVDKAVEALVRGYHLLIVDLFPPGPRDPRGIHAAIWSEFSDEDPVVWTPEEPLTLAAYSAAPTTRAYVEPTAVGQPLAEMPLFLTSERYINVPLEATYQGAYRGVPRRWRNVLEPDRHSG
jgi:hypothetical protein